MQTQTQAKRPVIGMKGGKVQFLPPKPIVEFGDGTQFVLIFSCPRKFVPEGIQVLPADSNSGTAAGVSKNDHRFNNAKVDLGGLMIRCIVDSINVRERNGYCRVYVNCTSAAGGEGFKHWHGPYEHFVRKALSGVWKRAVHKVHPDGRTSLELRDACQKDPETTIRFAIES